MSLSQQEQDAQDLKKLGYAQELFRDMGGFSNFAISFSIISILTGATQLYGYGLQHGGPFQITVGWIIVSIFTMTVALSMAELASAYPTAGALYHWASFLGGRTLGWFTAMFNTIGQFAILAGIDYGLTLFLISILEITPTPIQTMGIYASLLLSHSILNHIGIHVVAMLNNFSAWYHIAVVFLLLGALAYAGFNQPIEFLTTFHNTDGYDPKYSFLVGLLLAQWTLTGYDASAHVSEETVNPRKTAPWGIFLAVVISVVFGFLMLAAVTLTITDLSAAAALGDGAFVPLLKARLGEMGTAITWLIAGAMWLCGLSAMTSASRMVYAFARDGGLPFSHIWAKIEPKHRTPANAIWGLCALALLLGLSVEAYSAVVSIAVIALYISYGLPIAARLYSRFIVKKDEVGPWNLGSFSTPVALVAIVWIAFISVIFVLPPNDKAGLYIGGCVALLLVIWFLIARRKFKGPRYHV
ncbi:MAG TPA: amino acid permease [Bdellovibrionales bacterium]|nr:amino acid permease [Bdellovibrionales bacterium]